MHQQVVAMARRVCSPLCSRALLSASGLLWLLATVVAVPVQPHTTIRGSGPRELAEPRGPPAQHRPALQPGWTDRHGDRKHGPSNAASVTDTQHPAWEELEITPDVHDISPHEAEHLRSLERDIAEYLSLLQQDHSPPLEGASDSHQGASVAVRADQEGVVSDPVHTGSIPDDRQRDMLLLGPGRFIRHHRDQHF